MFAFVHDYYICAVKFDFFTVDFKQKRIAAVRNQHGQRFQQTSTSLTTSQPDNDKHAENSVQECKNTDDRNRK